MARVFLSYAREDVETAAKLADVLTEAGQTVWWDRNVHGGANFSNEIDRELKNAQIVMVLWTPASLASAWVQDEAAEGRDSGRLVPAVLDSVKPPLGFRQLQCIDLSLWNTQGKMQPIDDVLAAISKLAADDTQETQVGTANVAAPISICVLPFLNLSDDPSKNISATVLPRTLSRICRRSPPCPLSPATPHSPSRARSLTSKKWPGQRT